MVEPGEGEAPAAAVAHTALLVFDRERHANERDNAFVRPQPEHLAQIAACLHGQGVQHLIVVLPHDPFGLPKALKRGLANLDGHSVAALRLPQHAPGTRVLPPELAWQAAQLADCVLLVEAWLAGTAGQSKRMRGRPWCACELRALPVRCKQSVTKPR